ncbi:MAG: right-handed parallel beta-helix repeat-containing protein [Halobacteriota archaeon]
MQSWLDSARRRKSLDARPWMLASILLLSLFFGLVSHVSANELSVGTGQYTTIQAAVNAAKSGDTVSVAPGTYTENVLVNKPLTILAASARPTVRAADASKDVFLVTSPGVRVDGLTVTGGASGVHIQNTSKCVVTSIFGRDNVRGVYLSHSTENEISNCNLADNSYGIYGDSASSNTIASNVATGSTGNGQTLGDGIFLNYGDSNTITQNNLSANHVFGISLYSSPRNIISNNTFSDNDLVGVRLAPGSNDNTISFNTLARNGQTSHQSAQEFPPSGILIVRATGNKIYLNNFISEPSALIGASAAILNSPEKMVYTFNGVEQSGYMGNYYSDYKGADSDGNGVGDTSATTGDAYPLIHTIGQYEKVQLASAAASSVGQDNENVNASEQSVSTSAGGEAAALAIPTLIIICGIIAAIVIFLKWGRKEASEVAEKRT